MNESAPWDELLRRVRRYQCPCGSGGPMACDEDCPGDTTSSAVTEALEALIGAVQRIEARLTPEPPAQPEDR